MEHYTPHVNSSRLPNFQGKTVRFPCKVLRVQDDVAVVEAVDGGQVEVIISKDASIRSTYVVVVGNVQQANQIKMLACVNLGDEMDMAQANKVIELTYDSRFSHNFHGIPESY